MDITSELTIVIPVRIDCEERRENLDTVLFSLLDTTECSVIVLEADVEQKYFLPKQNARIQYLFVPDDAAIFHRTLYLNRLLKTAATDIVGVWDTDVILSADQIRDAATAIADGTTLCYPYDGRFLALSSLQSNDVKKDVIHFLHSGDKEEIAKPALGRPSAGGAFIVNRQRYLAAGGENENFYGWGPEDAERLRRLEILNEPVERISGVLFHLHHPRGDNSSSDLAERELHNVKELLKICRMDEAELKEYINTWRWKL